ncbi:MAG: PDDEXK nuclease domain-containing protein [Candidatus Obscuribacterales bacterium]|nr:PDDEXK nuclease domain-containing protein [Candidatus Obscuribacterales bacterium]
MPKKKQTPPSLAGYDEFLNELKRNIRVAQARAVSAVNRELILMYWEIGKGIIERQNSVGWGKSVVERLSHDLQHEFPEMKGFSTRNLWDMRRFYERYSGRPDLRQAVAEIPWGHNLLIMNSTSNTDEAAWYIRQTVENGWSRAVLSHQIETSLFSRQEKASKLSNFDSTLSTPQSELLQQALKDPYVFDFLNLGADAKERDLEKALIDRIREFLLELGAGFAFMGSQYHLEVDGDDFYIDLLFYHHRLRCLVAIDLKMEDFKPEFAGKMNFYLSALDDLVRHPQDQPSVGIILCRGKKRKIGEYSLRDMSKPIGVSAYKLTEALPKQLQGNLPAIEEIEAQLESVESAFAEHKNIDKE